VGALEMLMELALFGLPISAAVIFAAAFLSGRIKLACSLTSTARIVLRDGSFSS
jgi:hypothetical protein